METYEDEDGDGRPKADRATLVLVGRVRARIDEVVATMVERYRMEIVDYSILDRRLLLADVGDVSRNNLTSFLDHVERADRLTEAELEDFREGAARRVHQGVSLDALLQAYRIWSQTAWESVVASVDPAEPGELEAALGLAGGLIGHTNLVSTTIAKAYLDETEGVWSQSEVVRREVLEGLIAGSQDARLIAESADEVELADNYLAVVAATGGSRRSSRSALRRALSELAGEFRGVLVGLRHSRAVALCPVDSPAAIPRLRLRASAAASRLESDAIAIGLGGWHPGLEGVRDGYAEAEQALRIAIDRGMTGIAVAFEEVAIDHTLRTEPRVHKLLLDTLEPLVAYDGSRKGALLDTLDAYTATGFNLTRAAAVLSVHANTVVYRLRRIHELTGKDPHNTDDLLTLCLALRVHQLDSSDRPSPGR